MKMLYSVVFVTMLFFVSCQKDEPIKDWNSVHMVTDKTEQIPGNEELIVLDSVEVTADGALNFLSTSAYYRGVHKLLNRSHQQLESWEQSIGFISMRSEVKKIQDDTYALTDQTQKSDIVQQNSDLMEFGDKGEIEPIIEAVFYRNILNKAGYFYLNGDKYQITKENVTITYNNTDSLQTRTPSKIFSFSYVDTPITTRAQPGQNQLTGLSGCKSDKIMEIPGTYDELWIETKYKVYKNCLYPPATVGSGERFYILNYYVQLDAWQWKHNSWNNSWGYNSPSFDLFFRRIYSTIEDVTKQPGNYVGGGGDYHITYTIEMDLFHSEWVSVSWEESEEYWKKLPTLNLDYLSYQVGNSQYSNNSVNLVYSKPI